MPPAREKKVGPSLPSEPLDHALGRSRGGFGTKLHLVTDGHGLPLAVVVSPGQAHESQFVAPVLDAVRIARAGAGRPRQRPEAIAGDKGYSYGTIRRWLTQHHIRAVIPTRSNQRTQPAFDAAAYRQRHVIECTVGLLKEARRIATRYEKLATHFLGVLKLGMLQMHLALSLSNTP
jgi:transposase